MLEAMNSRISSLEKMVIKLTEQLEDNRRVAANMIRLAVVSRADTQTVDVKTGPNFAKRVPFLVLYAGKVSHYRRPSEGEQCLLLNLGSGDNLNNAVALMGLPSTMFPTPTTAVDEVVTDYGQGMRERYNLKDGTLIADYPGGVTITGNIKQLGSIQSSGDIHAGGELVDEVSSLNQVRTIYNGHTHTKKGPPEQLME